MSSRRTDRLLGMGATIFSGVTDGVAKTPEWQEARNGRPPQRTSVALATGLEQTQDLISARGGAGAGLRAVLAARQPGRNGRACMVQNDGHGKVGASQE